MYRGMCYLEGGNKGIMEKSVYSSCESWIVAASNQPQKHTGWYFCLLWQQLLSLIWVFWNEHIAGHFLLGSHHPVQFHWIRIATGMGVNTHRTLPAGLSEHSPLNALLMEWSHLSLDSLRQLSNYRDICFCLHGICSLMAEAACLCVTAGWLPF